MRSVSLLTFPLNMRFGKIVGMKITGTVRNVDETKTSQISASGSTYEEARKALEALTPAGSALIAIRADREE